MAVNIGTRIRQVRLMRGMTQEDLAEKVFIKKSTISAYENNAITLPVVATNEFVKVRIQSTPEEISGFHSFLD